MQCNSVKKFQINTNISVFQKFVWFFYINYELNKYMFIRCDSSNLNILLVSCTANNSERIDKHRRKLLFQEGRLLLISIFENDMLTYKILYCGSMTVFKNKCKIPSCSFCIADMCTDTIFANNYSPSFLRFFFYLEW